MRNYTVVIEPDEDGYHGFVPSLPGCHTFGFMIGGNGRLRPCVDLIEVCI